MPKMIAIHPGDILKTEFLEPMGISPYRLSRELHVSAPKINDVILQRRSITADLALRLARFFGTSSELWMGLQAEYDRRIALNSIPAAELVSIRPYAGRTQDFAASKTRKSA
jgi:addiction module HigA family antidote